MKDEESILFELGYKPCMNELETWRCEYSTGENQCEELWKIPKKDLITGEGNLYWDGLREFTLIGLKIQRLLNKHKWSMEYSNSEYDRETYKGWKEKLESMKIDEKILEDGINEMTYRMKGRDPSVRLKDWRIRITQNPFKGMSKEFARDMAQQLLEYFDTVKVDFRRWIEEIING